MLLYVCVVFKRVVVLVVVLLIVVVRLETTKAKDPGGEERNP